MSKAIKVVAGLAGVIHVLFFFMESIMWMNPSVHSVFLVESLADAAVLDVYVKNQGYYNLFLALGMFAGIYMLGRNVEIGRALVGYICAVMVGAAIVLFFTLPAMLTGVFIQGVAPAIVIAYLLFTRGSVSQS